MIVTCNLILAIRGEVPSDYLISLCIVRILPMSCKVNERRDDGGLLLQLGGHEIMAHEWATGWTTGRPITRFAARPGPTTSTWLSFLHIPDIQISWLQLKLVGGADSNPFPVAPSAPAA